MARNRWIVTGLSVAVLALSAAPAEAAGLGVKAGGLGAARRQRVAAFGAKRIQSVLALRADLALTPEQRAALVAIAKAYGPEAVPLVQKAVEKRRALREAVRADSPDEAAIRAAADGLGKAVGELAVVASKAVAEARKVLTSEQIAAIRQFVGERDKDVDAILDKVAPK